MTSIYGNIKDYLFLKGDLEFTTPWITLNAGEKEQLESQIKNLTLAVADDKNELVSENKRLESEIQLKEGELNKVEVTLKAIEVELESQLSSNSQLNENYEKLQDVRNQYDTLKAEFEDKVSVKNTWI